MENGKKYYRRIDILRIISCILILLYHLKIIKGGFLAVCTFFTLSGYLECISALINNNFSIIKYYKNRIKKLYIPLLLVISITLIITKQIPNIVWLNLKPETLSAIFGYNNFWQLKTNMDYFTKNINSPFIHLWYISILLQFDLVFPIIFVILKKLDEKISKHISAIIMLILSIFSTYLLFHMNKTGNIMNVYYNTFARSFSILWGVLFALIHYKYKLKIHKILIRYNYLINILYLSILITLCIFVSDKSTNYALYMIIVTFISLKLIKYSTLKSNKIEIKDKITMFISKCTYEIYLVQYPVIFFVQSLNINKNIRIPIIIITTLLASIILNVLVNTKLKHKIINGVRYIIIFIIIGIGTIILINEKDHTIQMRELENKLNDNLKIIEQKNKEYINNKEEESKKLEEMLANMDIENEKAVKELINTLPIVGVGDSVFLDAADKLYKRFPNGYFDGKVSRSIIGGKEVLVDLINKNKLGDIVVLALSQNGDYSERRNKDLMDLLGNREIYWVNAVGADDPTFNDKFEVFAKNYSNLHIVDWYSVSINHPEYFYKDGVHPKNNGLEIYADTIYKKIYDDYLEKYNKKKLEIIENTKKEEMNKIIFYGNDLLVNSFEYIEDFFNNNKYNTSTQYDYKSIYKDIENKINNKTLEHKIVFLYDKDTKITKDEYIKIINLCKDYEIFICNIIDNNLNINDNNVTVIDFNDEITNNKDYLMPDQKHLSKKGNKALIKLLYETINKENNNE